MKRIAYQPGAVKALRAMPANTARRIVGKIEAYARNPASLANNVTALKGRQGIRLRVGDWRVIILDREVIDVVKIAPRSSAYD